MVATQTEQHGRLAREWVPVPCDEVRERTRTSPAHPLERDSVYVGLRSEDAMGQATVRPFLVVATVAALALPATLTATETRPADRRPITPGPRDYREAPSDPYVAVPAELRVTGPARHWIVGSHVSVQVNVAANGQNIVGDAANEPSIAVDPTDPSRLAIGWRQFDTVTNNFRQAGRGFSTDGGRPGPSPACSRPGSSAPTRCSASPPRGPSTTTAWPATSTASSTPRPTAAPPGAPGCTPTARTSSG